MTRGTASVFSSPVARATTGEVDRDAQRRETKGAQGHINDRPVHPPCAPSTASRSPYPEVFPSGEENSALMAGGGEVAGHRDAVPRLALQRDPAAVQLHETLGQREAEAGPRAAVGAEAIE